MDHLAFCFFTSINDKIYDITWGTPEEGNTNLLFIYIDQIQKVMTNKANMQIYGKRRVGNKNEH